jgi:hypothetical protein
LELGVGQGRDHAHHGRDHRKKRAKRGAQKSPDIPGIVPDFLALYKPSTWKFTFSSVRTLNL